MASNGANHTRPLHKGSRPPMLAQHSSSVPSTPRQVPYDIRCSMRSPSPGAGLRRGSPPPGSSARDIATSKPAARSAPVVCKFETGAEFRKRRIPYKDGGNELLLKPEKEPKAALTPEEEAKLTRGMQALYEQLLPSEESEARRSELVQKLKSILTKAWPEEQIQVNVFGSSGNLLSSTDSDVDICLTTASTRLESMHSLATVLHENGMQKVVCRASAKVPIVKLWDPELELACDINVNNPLALDNTRMIKTYVQIDDRVRPLAKIVKYWTKRRILNDAAYGGTISSYTWICMIINFLQTRDPPILPSLQLLPDALKSTSDDGEKSPFADKVEAIRGFGAKNTESLGQLLFAFFRLYAFEIDYQSSVVCVREGRLLDRKDKGWDISNYHEKEARSRLCVEEPFNTVRNLGNSADEYAFNGIHEEVRRAFDLIARGDLEECCEQFVFPPEPEKSVFQRAVPKPKPVLTRSASQSNRSSNTPSNGGRSGSSTSGSRSNRAPSTHRTNSRRASSGASYAGRFAQSPFSNPSTGQDYFGSPSMSQEQIHEQLLKQYQILQAKQEALRTQLLQQQQQVQWQHGSPTTSRTRHFANSVSSPRSLDGTAGSPLLPGYLYHYPVHFPANGTAATHVNSQAHVSGVSAQSPGIQQRSGPGVGSSAAVRSQSQPGRSYPSPVTIQSMVHPGYDVSGVVGSTYVAGQPLQLYTTQQHRGVIDANSFAQLGHFAGNPAESPIPKEYVGYYVGQGLPVDPALHSTTLPRRPRRSSPERPAGVFNGSSQRSSRSPPKSNRERHSSNASVMSSASVPQTPSSRANQSVHIDTNGPVIVNGSTTNTPTAVHCDPIALNESTAAHEYGQNGYSVSLETNPQQTRDEPAPAPSVDPGEGKARTANGVAIQAEGTNTTEALNVRPRPAPPKLDLSPRAGGQAQDPQEIQPPATASILSPVVEMRTPSPTGSRGYNTPRPDVGSFTQMIQPDPRPTWDHRQAGREYTISTRSDGLPTDVHTTATSAAQQQQQNRWQQAGRKGQKKSGAANSGPNGGGEPLPENEADRKGG